MRGSEKAGNWSGKISCFWNMTDKTPVKVYTNKISDNSASCFLCDINFAANGTRPAYKIFGKLKSSSESDFYDKIKKVFPEVIHVAQPALQSAVSCKGCHSRIGRFVKTLDEIAAFKKCFDDILSHINQSHSSSSPEKCRIKRCSKSPHKGGPPLKMLPIFPIILPKFVQTTASTTQNLCRKSPSSLIDQENLPFKDMDFCNERQPKLTTVDVCTVHFFGFPFSKAILLGE